MTNQQGAPEALRPIQRYKIGRHTDEWGVRYSTPGGIADPSGQWVLYKDHLAALASHGQAPAQAAPQPSPTPQADSQPASTYSIDADTQGIRARVADAITGALAFGAQGAQPPPTGHWLAPFWEMAREEVIRAARAPADSVTAPAAGNWIAADDVNRLVRELDVALNGEDGAAPQASLCDVVSQVKHEASKLGRPVLAAPAAVAGPMAVVKFERGTSGRENEMPRVVSCNWMPDGEYEVYLAAAPPTQPAPQQEATEALARAEYYIDNPSAWSSFDQRASDAIAAVCKAFRAARAAQEGK